MDILRQMTLSGCFIGIVLCAADVLAPEQSFSKQIKTIFSLIFILVFLSPLVKSSLSHTDDGIISASSDISYEDMEQAVESDIKKFTEKNLERTLGKLLDDKKILYDKISVSVNIDNESGININRVYITSVSFKQAKEALEEVLDEQTQILREEK